MRLRSILGRVRYPGGAYPGSGLLVPNGDQRSKIVFETDRPVKEPPNRPQKPPVEEPITPPEPPPQPNLPPEGDPASEPPPVGEPPPGDPNRKPPHPPVRKVGSLLQPLKAISE